MNRAVCGDMALPETGVIVGPTENGGGGECGTDECGAGERGPVAQPHCGAAG